MRTRILLIFALSGAAGLIDEIVWSRQLVLVFGNTTQAVSAILTGFFAGMAIGAPIGGRIADRVRSPLRLYGFLEFALAIVVIATPLTFRAHQRDLPRHLPEPRRVAPGARPRPHGPRRPRPGPGHDHDGRHAPSLTRYLTQDGHLSKAFGRLYAANIIGAILGTLAAGFILIELLGLTGALAVGAGCSAIAGGAALVPGSSPSARRPRRAADDRPRRSIRPAAVHRRRRPRARRRPGRGRVGLALTIAFVSGPHLARLPGPVDPACSRPGTGNTTYVFTVILALFLIGLAIGALLFNIVRPRINDPARLLAAAQVLIGALVLFGLVVVIARRRSSTPADPIGVLVSLFGSAVLGRALTTVVLGLTFPAASAMLADDPRDGRPQHRARSSRSTRSVRSVGSFLVPFLLIPWLGSPQATPCWPWSTSALGAAIALDSPSRPGIRWTRPDRRRGVVAHRDRGRLARAGRLVSPNAARLQRLGATSSRPPRTRSRPSRRVSCGPRRSCGSPARR